MLGESPTAKFKFARPRSVFPAISENNFCGQQINNKHDFGKKKNREQFLIYRISKSRRHLRNSFSKASWNRLVQTT